jgi:hypothetical protein
MPYHDSGRIRSMTAYKRQGITRTRGEEDTEKKEQKTGEQKTQKKKRTHTKKKNTRAGKRRSFFGENHHFHLCLRLRLRHCQVRPSFSLCFCISCCKIRKQGEGNLIIFALCGAHVV